MGRAPAAGLVYVRGMASRATWLVLVLVLIGGCILHLPYRDRCDPDAGESCCPPGSHWLAEKPNDPNDNLFICAPDADAGADACDDADADGH